MSGVLHNFSRTLALGLGLFTLTHAALAQMTPTPVPLADSKDVRFQGVKEDWTSPSLANSQLKPVRPLEFITDKPGYTSELVRLQWRADDPVDVYVIKPKGKKNPPVIIYLYGYPTDTDVFTRDEYQELVTRNGMAAVGFVSALTGYRYHDRPMKDWFVSELQESLVTSAHDVQMVLNYLTTRGDLNMDRVGMFAQGSGASIAILASAVDPRIKVLEALDPWGDWPTWMANSPFVPEDERPAYLKPEFLGSVASLDPVDWLPRTQAKKVRLDIELFDTVTPKAAKDRLQAAVPARTSIQNFKNMDDFRDAFQDGENLRWIRRALESLPETRTAESTAVYSSHP